MSKTVELEQIMLSSLLLAGECMAQCTLSREDFTVATHAAIFDALRQCERNGTLIDIVTVSEAMERNGTLEACGGMNYIKELCKAPGTPLNFTHYQGMIKAEARKRRAKQIAINLQFQLDEHESDDAVSLAIRELMAIDVQQKNYNRTLADSLKSGLEDVRKAFDRDGMTGITSGLVEVDQCIGGFHESDLIVIAARPGMGKTALMLSAAHAANVPCGIISAEQSGEQAALRLLSIDGSIHSQNLRCAKLEGPEWTRVDVSSRRLFDRPIWINDQPAIDINAVIRQARLWKYHNGIKALYVDYIQKLRGTNQKLARWEQITDIVQQLKNLARELQIPVIALAQVKRDVDQRSDKRPRMGDISDASEIEKEADLIMTLYRDTENAPGVAEILIEKNRHGDTGSIMCQYVGKYFQFKTREGYRREYA